MRRLPHSPNLGASSLPNRTPLHTRCRRRLSNPLHPPPHPLPPRPDPGRWTARTAVGTTVPTATAGATAMRVRTATAAIPGFPIPAGGLSSRLSLQPRLPPSPRVWHGVVEQSSTKSPRLRCARPQLGVGVVRHPRIRRSRSSWGSGREAGSASRTRTRTQREGYPRVAWPARRQRTRRTCVPGWRICARRRRVCVPGRKFCCRGRRICVHRRPPCSNARRICALRRRISVPRLLRVPYTQLGWICKGTSSRRQASQCPSPSWGIRLFTYMFLFL